MTTAELRSGQTKMTIDQHIRAAHHIERNLFLANELLYRTLYWAYYSDWTPQPPKRSFGQTGLRTN